MKKIYIFAIGAVVLFLAACGLTPQPGTYSMPVMQAAPQQVTRYRVTCWQQGIFGGYWRTEILSYQPEGSPVICSRSYFAAPSYLYGYPFRYGYRYGYGYGYGYRPWNNGFALFNFRFGGHHHRRRHARTRTRGRNHDHDRDDRR